MKYTIVTIIYLLSFNAHARLKLSGKITNASPGDRVIVNIPYDNWFINEKSVAIQVDSNGKFSIELPVNKPQLFFVDFAGKRIHLYGEPDKALFLTFDAKSLESTLQFNGDLKNENNFWAETGLTFYRLGPKTYHDSLDSPGKIFHEIISSQDAAIQKLSALNKTTSADFKRITASDIKYFIASKIWDIMFKTGAITVNQKSKYGLEDWREFLIKAYENLALSNDSALDSYHYQQVITYFPRYLNYKFQEKENFVRFVERIFDQPFEEIHKEVKAKGEKYFDYKAYEYALEGLSLQRALASMIINGVQQGELEYLMESYKEFKKTFPDSPYLTDTEKAMKPYLNIIDTPAKDIEFIVDSSEIETLEQILQLASGKVIYLDLWGTWCGPCRQEFAYIKELKDRFKDKPVEFIYVAFEHQTNPEKIWRETVKFYNLTGKHVLAGEALNEEFRELYKDKGHLTFPSYLLIDKTGEVITDNAEHPSSREKLYKQIEEAL